MKFKALIMNRKKSPYNSKSCMNKNVCFKLIFSLILMTPQSCDVTKFVFWSAINSVSVWYHFQPDRASTNGVTPSCFGSITTVAIPSLFIRFVLFLKVRVLENFVVIISKKCTYFEPVLILSYFQH